jgi:hypothetical protein
VILFVAKFFAIFPFRQIKIPKQHGQGNFLENFQKALLHFEELFFEIEKIFGGFGFIFKIILKSPYLATGF